MPVVAEGGCLCGAVRYRVEGDVYHRTVCHCTECRAASGAPMVAWASVGNEGFDLFKGRLRSFVLDKGDVRGFCGDCGTSLTFQSKELKDVELDFTIASLDEPGAVEPLDEVWTRSRISWTPAITRGPQHETSRTL